jgi:Zn-dependent protease with chaperone function
VPRSVPFPGYRAGAAYPIITAVNSITGDLCPECRTPSLTSLPDHAPWCADCEWNLDHFPPDPRSSWFWNRIATSDQRAGFRSDLELSRSDAPVAAGGFRFLVTLSAVLVTLMLALVAVGLWLIIAGGLLWPAVLGVVLIGVAALLRPRFGRLKTLLKRSYLVSREKRPGWHGLIDRIADEVDAPRPDVLLFNFSWNAGVFAAGWRRRRVLVLGVPLLLSLRPQEVVALIGHELGHIKYDDNRRILFTQPARTTFGRLSALIRPPQVSALEIGPSLILIGLLFLQLTAGTVSWLLFATHLGINAVAGRDSRTVELRADELAARAAGTEATLHMLDVLAMLPSLLTYVQHHVPRGEAAALWRRMLRSVQEREAPTAPAWRQLSNRTDASLLATHPAPGRRHQWLATRPRQQAAVALDEEDAARLERELAPYAEALHRTMLRYTTEEPF